MSSDTLLGLTGRDAAGNTMSCNTSGYQQYTCEADPPSSGDPHFVEYYTPGLLSTTHYHEAEEYFSNTITNFGHSVIIGDFDKDGNQDDVAVGAPAFSYTSSTLSNEAKGAVYIWFDGIRERAQISLTTNDTTTDVTGRYMDFFSLLERSIDQKKSLLCVGIDPQDLSSEENRRY